MLWRLDRPTVARLRDFAFIEPIPHTISGDGRNRGHKGYRGRLAISWKCIVESERREELEAGLCDVPHD